MIRTLIKWAFIALIAIIAYNYFFGDESEQQQSQQIINKTKDIGAAIVDLVSDESERIQEGKYDDVVDNIQGVIDKLKNSGEENDPQLNNLENELDQTRKNIDELSETSTDSLEKKKDSIESQLQQILQKLKGLKSN